MRAARRLWLIVPPLVALVVDVALTLIGQPAEYWSADYQAAVEVNPLALPILVRGPWLFVALAAFWGALMTLTVGWCRQGFSDRLAVLVTFGHAIGGSCWLVRYGPWGWVAAVAYLATISEVIRWAQQRLNQIRRESVHTLDAHAEPEVLARDSTSAKTSGLDRHSWSALPPEIVLGRSGVDGNPTTRVVSAIIPLIVGTVSAVIRPLVVRRPLVVVGATRIGRGVVGVARIGRGVVGVARVVVRVTRVITGSVGGGVVTRRRPPSPELRFRRVRKNKERE